jgi:hypothetical protein
MKKLILVIALIVSSQFATAKTLEAIETTTVENLTSVKGYSNSSIIATFETEFNIKLKQVSSYSDKFRSFECKSSEGKIYTLRLYTDGQFYLIIK